jgi:DNA polymerase-3 subunit epsilon
VSGAFVAIDFETANPSRDSACAVGLVRVEAGRITLRERRLIRPPTARFTFTWVHGIDWHDVKGAPEFATVWAELAPLLSGAQFLAAHNAGFDRSVLEACCRLAGVQPPPLPMRCSMRMARDAWDVYPTTLPDVCRHLGLELDHHDPLSDAEACARIVIAATKAPSAPRRRR